MSSEEAGMSLMATYKDTLELAGELIGDDLEVSEDGGKVKLKGTAQWPMQKNMIWDSIKSHDGWDAEVAANIKVADESVYGKYTVQKGDTLGKIAERLLGKAGRYNEIFEANRDTLKNPDLIHPDQVLTIPKK
jgi:nucleoid-associated protein YgaU